jgi:membrane-bound ClpP family serine protease
LIFALTGAASLHAAPQAALIDIEGPIGPATSLYLQTLVDVATRNTATIVVPVPLELLQALPKQNA